jgi:hypothetical protein
MNLQTMRLSNSRDVHVIPDAKARLITLALTSTARPSGTLVQPEQDHFDSRLRSLMNDYSDTALDQLAMTAYSADPLTGMPTAVTRYIPVTDEHGLLALEPAHADPPASVATHDHYHIRTNATFSPGAGTRYPARPKAQLRIRRMATPRGPVRRHPYPPEPPRRHQT